MIGRPEETARMRVVLADDHRDVRQALRLLLEQEAVADIPGEAEDAQQLLSQVSRWRPDIILLDWELPGMAGEAVLGQLRTCCPLCTVIVLSGQPEARGASLNAGANAFVSKADPPERLVAQVQACSRETDKLLLS